MSSNKQTANPIIESIFMTRSLLQLLAPTYIRERNQKEDNRHGNEDQVQHYSLLSIDVVTQFKVEEMISIRDVCIAE
jgi:hypothetical protein